MINRIIRYYNQNRKAIIIFIISVAFVIFLVQSLNNMVVEKNQSIINQQKVTSNQVASSTNNDKNSGVVQTNNINNNVVNNTKPELTGTKKTIDEFVQYCNAGEIEKAYNLLTDDCKKIIFPNIEKFKNEYYNKIFTNKKIYSTEKSIYGNSILKITYYDDILSTGIASDDKIVDYIYPKNENGQDKISINNFLYIDQINKSHQGKELNIDIIEKQVYIDYEIYTIKFTNNSANKILLDTKKDNNSTNISDNNKTEYASYIDNIATDMLVLGPNVSRTIELKFNKMFNTNRKIDKMNFLDIVSNYDNYIAGKEYETIKISIKL